MVPLARPCGKHVMKRRLVLAVLPSLVLARSALGQTFAFRNLAIDHPWAKPSVTEAAAVFMVLRNNGQRVDRLVSGSTPIADKVILREFDGTPLEFFELQPRKPVALKPGRRYIALRGLRRILAVEDSFPLSLKFAEGGTIDLTVVVEEGTEEP